MDILVLDTTHGGLDSLLAGPTMPVPIMTPHRRGFGRHGGFHLWTL
jgi:hypothetical protein